MAHQTLLRDDKEVDAVKNTTSVASDSPRPLRRRVSQESVGSCPADAVAANLESPRSARHAPLLFLLLLALALRLPGVTRPLVGNFATKSAVYGMIARNLAEGRASFLYPTLDVMRGGERSYHLTELPVSAYLTAGLWKLFGGSLDVWGRATSIAWSLAAIAWFYFLLSDWHGDSVARCGAAALALSPVAIIYGQSFQLEASVLALTILTIWSADRWFTERRTHWLATAVASAMLLLLTKIYMVYLIVILFYLAWRRWGEGVFRCPTAWCAVVVAGLPALVWYGHVYLGTTGDMGFDPERVYYSVRQSASVHGFPHPLLTSAGFYKHLLDDLSGAVLTPVGLVLALLGICRPVQRRYGAWLAGCGLLVLLLPRKFYEMNYYWIAVLPPLCALAGLGWARIAEMVARRRRALFVLGGAWLLLSLRLSVTPAFSTPPEDASVVEAGRAVQNVSRPGERVITLHGSSLDLLYYCNRPGWTLPTNEARPAASWIEAYRTEGAAYLVIAGLKQLDAVDGLRGAVEGLPIAAEGNDYVVFRLGDLGF